MLRTAVIICLACLYQATAVPYTAVAPSTEEQQQHSGEANKLLFSEGEDAEEAEDDEGVLDADALPDDADDLDLVSRELRNKNFLRFGRSSSSQSARSTADNLIRLRRAGAGNPVKAPSTRSSNSHFIRLGRSGDGDAAREGRGSGSNFIRLGKAAYPGSSSFMRLGRRDNFLRFGRAGPNSNFIRLGKADNFLRFGRGGSSSNFIRLGKADNFLRFGRGGVGSNFIRLGKADPFIRLGRNAPNFNEFRFPETTGGDTSHFGRGKLADRNFIRLGRSNPEAESADESADTPKAEAENSWATFIRHAPRTVRLGKRELEVTDNNSNNNRSKRSIEPTSDEEFDSEDEDANFRYYRPLSSRIPNYVFAPELAVLPPLYSKRGTGTGSSNFIRLG